MTSEGENYTAVPAYVSLLRFARNVHPLVGGNLLKIFKNILVLTDLQRNAIAEAMLVHRAEIEGDDAAFESVAGE